MKRAVVATMLAIGTLVFGADSPKPARRRGMPSPEERARIYRKYQERKLAKEGGMVVRADPARRRVVFANAQERVPHADVEAVARAIGERYSIETAAMKQNGDVTVETAGMALKENGAGAVVVVADMPRWPAVLAAPESRWVVVNVRALTADGKENMLNERFRKEAWRAFAFVGGAANTLQGECLMRPVETLSDLDHLKAQNLSPEPDMRIREHLAALGVRPVVRASYLQACREGWAPPPTNDVQKAVWEQAKADKERGPTNPITIPPPNQKK